MLGRFNEDVSSLTKAIRRGDGDALFEHFTAPAPSAKALSDRSGRPDFGVRIRNYPRRKCRDPTRK